jgi:hypothetical protein
MRRLYEQIARAQNWIMLPLNPIVTAPLVDGDAPRDAREPAGSMGLGRQVLTGSGVILVTGYRGVGKSSFVNLALQHHVPVLEREQDHTDATDATAPWIVVPVQVNVAKATSVDGVLRLCVRRLYRDLLQHPRAQAYLRKEERQRVALANLRVSYKVDWKNSASIQTLKRLEAALDVKLAELLPKPMVGGFRLPLPGFGGKWSREWTERLDQTISLLDYDEDRAEDDLIQTIEMLTQPRLPAKAEDGRKRIKLAVVYDEMDKMPSEVQEQVIERCKNLFLSRDAVFVIVTSKDFYYKWLRDRGSEDRVLSSYFSTVLNIPLFNSADTRRLLDRVVDPPAADESQDLLIRRGRVLDDLAFYLTNRAGGLPREVVRELQKVQQWLPGGVQAYLSDRSDSSAIIECYSQIQTRLESLWSVSSRVPGTAPETTDTNASVASQPSAPLSSGRVWEDEARREQVQRGLYVLVEDLIEQGGIDIEAPTPPRAGETPTPLYTMFQNNFSLVTAEEFASLLGDLASHLQTVRDSNGIGLFSVATTPAKRLVVEPGFYQVTGHARPTLGNLVVADDGPPLETVERLLTGENDSLVALESAVRILRSPGVSQAIGPAEQPQVVALLKIVHEANYASAPDDPLRPVRAGLEVNLLTLLAQIGTETVDEAVLATLVPDEQLPESWIEPLTRIAQKSGHGMPGLLQKLYARNAAPLSEGGINLLLKNERGPQLIELWQLVVGWRRSPLGRSLVIAILRSLPQYNTNLTPVLDWLRDKEWGEADAEILNAAASGHPEVLHDLERQADAQRGPVGKDVPSGQSGSDSEDLLQTRLGAAKARAGIVDRPSESRLPWQRDAEDQPPPPQPPRRQSALGALCILLALGAGVLYFWLPTSALVTGPSDVVGRLASALFLLIFVTLPLIRVVRYVRADAPAPNGCALTFVPAAIGCAVFLFFYITQAVLTVIFAAAVAAAWAAVRFLR